MGFAQKKDSKLFIPERDKSIIAMPKPAISKSQNSHNKQFCGAMTYVFLRYRSALEKLSKV